MSVIPIIPIFRIFDYAKAVEFYIDYLGFSIDWEHIFHDNSPVYLQISYKNIVLHLSEHYGDSTPGSKIIINFQGLEDYYETLSSKNYKYLNPGIEITDRDIWCVSITDPFGNKIEFNEKLT
jgi:hypothetical protein